MKSNKLLINGVEYNYEYRKLDERIEFDCFRCGKSKIAKKFAEIKVGEATEKICNGCYGYILSQQQ